MKIYHSLISHRNCFALIIYKDSLRAYKGIGHVECVIEIDEPLFKELHGINLYSLYL